MTFVFPEQDLDKPAQLVSLLGSFWSGTYGGSQFAEHFAYARAQLEKQTGQNLQESIDATSRFKVPVYHTDLWYQLVLRESQMNTRDFSVPKYGEPYVYGPQADSGVTLRYGEPINKGVYAFASPRNLAAAPFICNRTDAPSISWLDGLDYVIEDGYLKFRNNPFDSPLIPTRPVYQNGVEVDREAALWLFRSKWDLDYLWTYFGHVIGLDLPSSETYRAAINSVWDTMVEGSQRRSVEELLAAVADAPCTIEEETVEVVLKDSAHLAIVTDKRAYRTNRDAAALVAVGDTVPAGTFLTDAVRLHDLNSGEKPDWLFAYTLDEHFTDRKYTGGVTFVDDDAEVTVTEENGYTKIEFPLGGNPDVVSDFWAEVHRRGVAKGETMAHLLDTRPTSLQTGEPPAGALPSTINPLKFLLANVFRGNSIVVALKPQSFGPASLPISTLRLLRRMLSPYETVLLIVQLAFIEDPPPQTNDDIMPFVVATPLVENPVDYATHKLLVPSYVDGVCL